MTAPAARTSSSGGIPKVKLKTGTRSSTTTATWASSSVCGSTGARTSVGAATSTSAYSGASAESTWVGSASASNGGQAKTLTPNGLSVSSRIRRIVSRSSSGAVLAAPTEPSPPAFETAATSSGVVEPAIGAWMIGYWIPSPRRHASSARPRADSIQGYIRYVEQISRRELLERGGRLALALPLAGPLAWAAPPTGIFAELARRLQGDVVTPGEAGYDQARVLYNTRFDAVRPRAVVFCESLQDVERTVHWARKHKVRIAPRSGGHSYGGYSTTTGVVVDVSRIAAVSVDAQHRAAVGAGARLIDVYDRLWLRGVTVPAGTCPTVGIAGLALGGGIGFAARKFGLTCDNLVEARIVLANGKALNCNAREHPDLYWALRGAGGGSFGIVTRLVFRTHPVGMVSTYSLEWPWADARRVVAAWQRLAPHAPDGLFSVLNLNAGGGAAPHITSAGPGLRPPPPP